MQPATVLIMEQLELQFLSFQRIARVLKLYYMITLEQVQLVIQLVFQVEFFGQLFQIQLYLLDGMVEQLLQQP